MLTQKNSTRRRCNYKKGSTDKDAIKRQHASDISASKARVVIMLKNILKFFNIWIKTNFNAYLYVGCVSLWSLTIYSSRQTVTGFCRTGSDECCGADQEAPRPLREYQVYFNDFIWDNKEINIINEKRKMKKKKKSTENWFQAFTLTSPHLQLVVSRFGPIPTLNNMFFW